MSDDYEVLELIGTVMGMYWSVQLLTVGRERVLWADSQSATEIRRIGTFNCYDGNLANNPPNIAG